MKAFIFPGQGTQAIGMGKEIYNSFPVAKAVYEEINESIGYKIEDVIFKGTEQDLAATDKSQIAIMATSVAVINVLIKEFNFDLHKHINFVAGHSLGEYSALLTAGAFNVSVAAKLLKLRGEAMLGASPLGFSGMVAIIGLNDNKLINKMIAKCKVPDEVCNIAADNGLGQVVISGHKQSLDNIIAKAQDYGARKAISLPVSGAFHSPLMQSAAEKVAIALADISIKPLHVALVPNVTATATKDSSDIKELLVKQIVEGVRWRESMLYLQSQGVTEVIEVGNGSVLTGLMKRTAPNVARVNLQFPKDIEDFMKNI